MRISMKKKGCPRSCQCPRMGHHIKIAMNSLILNSLESVEERETAK